MTAGVDDLVMLYGARLVKINGYQRHGSTSCIFLNDSICYWFCQAFLGILVRCEENFDLFYKKSFENLYNSYKIIEDAKKILTQWKNHDIINSVPLVVQ